MKKGCIIFFIYSCFQLFGQPNLVPNPGFEIYDTCPDYYHQINRAVPWFRGTGGTSDFFHGCSSSPMSGVPANFAGIGQAHGGKGMAGLFTVAGVHQTGAIKYREYIAVKLKDTLTTNQNYYVTFYTKLAYSYSQYTINQMSVFFSKDSIAKPGTDTIHAIPQITNSSSNFFNISNWTKISGNFIATGGEKYLYIGNFHADVTNDTLFLGTQGYPHSYEPNGVYCYLDDICVSTDSVYCSIWTGLSETQAKKSITVFPNPNSGYLSIEMNGSKTITSIIIRDLYGETVKKIYDVNSFSYFLDLTSAPSGAYFLTINLGDETINRYIIKTNP